MAQAVEEVALRWAIDNDQDLRVSVRKLAWMMMAEAFDILENGRPQDKMVLLTRLVPPMLRALGEEDQTGRGIDQLREDLNQVLKEVRLGPGEQHDPANAPDRTFVDPRQELPGRPVST